MPQAELGHPRSVTRRLARGASIYIAGLLIGKALVLAIQIILGRALGAVAYGLYALGYSIITLLQWLGSLGLDQGVLRYCALYRSRGEDKKAEAALGTALRLASITSVALAIVFIALSWPLAAHFFHLPNLSRLLALFALTLPFLVWTRILATSAQARHDMYGMTMLQHVAQPLSNLTLLVIMLAAGFRLYGAVGALLAGTVFSSALGVFYLKPMVAVATNHRADRAETHLLVRYSAVLMLAGFSFQLILRIPSLLLGHLSNAREVGLYSAGASFALAFNFVPLVFAQPSLPLMVELHDAGHSPELYRLYHTVTRWTLAAVVPMFLFLALFQDQVMRLFGRDFHGSGRVLAVLSLGWIVYYATGPTGALLEMTGRQNLVLANMSAIALLLGIAAYLVIPDYGALGAAAASSAAIVIWALVEFIQVKIIYGLLPWDSAALRHMLASLAVAAVGIYLRSRMSTALAAALIVAGYVLVYFGFCLGPEDRSLLGAFIARFRTPREQASAAAD